MHEGLCKPAVLAVPVTSCCGMPVRAALCPLRLVNTASSLHNSLLSGICSGHLATVTKPGLAMAEGRDCSHRLLCSARHATGSRVVREAIGHTTPIVTTGARLQGFSVLQCKYKTARRSLPHSPQFRCRTRNARLKEPLNGQSIDRSINH
jgi:hypothetical protein